MNNPLMKIHATSRYARAFSLMELLVVIAIVSVLAALLLPTLEASLEQARQVACAGNQRQLYAATQLYANDWRDAIPPRTYNLNNFVQTWGWHAGLVDGGYGIEGALRRCPSQTANTGWNNAFANGGKSGNYPWHGSFYMETAAVQKPSNTSWNNGLFRGLKITDVKRPELWGLFCDVVSYQPAGNGNHPDGGQFTLLNGTIRWFHASEQVFTNHQALWYDTGRGIYWGWPISMPTIKPFGIYGGTSSTGDLRGTDGTVIISGWWR